MRRPASAGPTTTAPRRCGCRAAARWPGGSSTGSRAATSTPTCASPRSWARPSSGSRRAWTPPPPIEGNAYEQDLPQIPATWAEAIDAFERSELARRIFPRLADRQPRHDQAAGAALHGRAVAGRADRALPRHGLSGPGRSEAPAPALRASPGSISCKMRGKAGALERAPPGPPGGRQAARPCLASGALTSVARDPESGARMLIGILETGHAPAGLVAGATPAIRGSSRTFSTARASTSAPGPSSRWSSPTGPRPPTAG